MSLSNSVSRRYTPPTCTLQIIARRSPLSRWAGRSVLRQLRFDLHLDDPQLSEDKRIDIQGDGDQLETLHAELTNYVQHLLNQSPHLSTVLLSPTATHLDTTGASSSQALSTVDAAQVPDEASSASSPAALNSEVAGDSNNTANNRQIHLSQGAGLTHNLFLGPLATEATGPFVPLGTLEIFDLVTALDEYAADMVALPASGRRFSAPPAWVNIAALVLVTAGLSTAVMQILDRQQSQQQVATNVPPDLSGNPQGVQPSPLPGGGPTLLPTPETLPPAALPPLGAVPPPSSRLQPRAFPRLTPVPGNPGGLRVQRTPGFPSIPRPGSGQIFTTTPIRPELPQAPIFVDPKAQQNRSVYNPFKPGISAPGGARTSSLPDGLPGTAKSLPQLSPANPDLATSSSAANSSTGANTTGVNNAPTLPGGGSSTPANPKEPKSTAFDTIPQVAEAREFFKQRWNPPSTLTQTLEYNLILGVDGKIQRIEPLSQASRNYIDRTGMPLVDEPFVSPNKSGQAATIRVVLSPDGKVQTFAQ